MIQICARMDDLERLIFPTVLQLYDLYEKLRHIFFKRSYLLNKYLCILQ
jgi:hypothetical protein